MHCWKILNLRHHYGITRIVILAAIIFFMVFSFSYVTLNLTHHEPYTDRLFWLFILTLIVLYPIHKLLHFLALSDLRAYLKLRIRLHFHVLPVLHMRIREPLPKNRYIIALLTPFIVINICILLVIYFFPSYTHYGTLLLACHCSLCSIDMLYVKFLLKSPKNSQIEETPKGYEILVPPSIP
ncbi:DUF3267 domain-containing protein [Lysinibacillus piscis]|uniref:Membrane protein n=1 Tax=Lysinibacillus piscis TaxID=2518931 RepID=A0ABQ5NNF0_9BACI|nr:DUF3267 domain-containing protein [Lysinibacillus sp. KH24]GLC89878.1 membrane protein [Lysinibacillus sp. KH24]